MNVLVVEDDKLLGSGLVRALEQAGYAAEHAPDGAWARAALEGGDHDLVILDLGLPDADGLDILRGLRRRRLSIPVLVLTARDGVEHRVAALDAGADDYLEKPFDLRELEARVRALLRRSQMGFDEEIRLGTLTLNPFTREVRCDGTLLDLPVREFEVLEMLAMNANKVVTKARIAQRLTASNDDIGDNAVEVYVHRLRRRLGDHGLRIRTLRGVGYLVETG
ncbi:MAG: response regulator [Gammaproteobacteria bacterium]|nr:response regulator [Gammaproteobacteria bacterium]MCP5201866.1 response regulator [Gammaproteobacteria bacterium]